MLKIEHLCKSFGGLAATNDVSLHFLPGRTSAVIGALHAHREQSAVVRWRFPIPGTQARAREVMDMLGLAANATTLSSNLSHGDQKLLDIALARVAHQRPL